MEFEIQFSHPINGWWDEGARTGGVFTVDENHSLPGNTCFGSWMLNHFFNVKTGKDDKETLENAIRYLKRHCKVSFTVIKRTLFIM